MVRRPTPAQPSTLYISAMALPASRVSSPPRTFRRASSTPALTGQLRTSDRPRAGPTADGGDPMDRIVEYYFNAGVIADAFPQVLAGFRTTVIVSLLIIV